MLRNGSNAAGLRLLTALLLSLFLLLQSGTVNSKVYSYFGSDSTAADEQQQNEQCPLNPALHNFMDRICEMCHTLFSHTQPNLRADCRRNCFDNTLFETCMNLFSSSSTPSTDSEQPPAVRRRRTIRSDRHSLLRQDA